MLMKRQSNRKTANRGLLRGETMRSFYQNRVIEQFASIATKRVTLRQLIAFSRNINHLKLLKSANYVREELSVRLGMTTNVDRYDNLKP